MIINEVELLEDSIAEISGYIGGHNEYSIRA